MRWMDLPLMAEAYPGRPPMVAGNQCAGGLDGGHLPVPDGAPDTTTILEPGHRKTRSGSFGIEGPPVSIRTATGGAGAAGGTRSIVWPDDPHPDPVPISTPDGRPRRRGRGLRSARGRVLHHQRCVPPELPAWPHGRSAPPPHQARRCHARPRGAVMDRSLVLDLGQIVAPRSRARVWRVGVAVKLPNLRRIT